MNTLTRRGSAASQRGRKEKSSFPRAAEVQNDDFLARAEQRRFFGSFLATKRNIPMQSIGTGHSAAKGALSVAIPPPLRGTSLYTREALAAANGQHGAVAVSRLASAHSAAGGRKSFSFPFSKKENLLILFRGKEL